MASTELCPPDDSCANMSKHPPGALLAAVLGRPMDLTGKHMPGVRCSGGHINISTVVHTIETHLPLPDLACCIVRRGLTR